MPGLKDFFAELQRRNVVRAAIAHVLVFWLLVQAADVILPYMGVVDNPVRWAIVAGVALFPGTLIVAWFIDHPWHHLTRSRIALDVVVILVITVTAASWVVRNIPQVIHTRTSVFELSKQTDRANALKAVVQEFLPKQLEIKPGFAPAVAALTAQTHLWRGDIDRALSDLESVPGAYMRHAWYLSRDPGLESLHGHPQFEAVVDAIQKRIDSDRAELEKLGDNLPPCVTNMRTNLQ